MSNNGRFLRRAAMAAGLAGAVCFPLHLGAQRGMPEDIGGVPGEKEFVEDGLKLPPYPSDADLIEFRPRGSSRNRFYIERNSVSLGADDVVRYTAVIRSPSGVANVSYEGLRCKTSEYKVYAYGAKDKGWVGASEPQWRSVGASGSNYRYSLWVDYLCDSEAVGGRNAKDLVARLAGDPRSNPRRP